MPSQIAHMLAAHATLARVIEAHAAQTPGFLGGLSSRTRSGLSPWFDIGCQGPDIFYHSQRTRPTALHIGCLLHRRGIGSLVSDGAEASIGDEAALDFFAGFATHAALDRSLHPYIVSRSGWYDPAHPESERFRYCHAFLERLIDEALTETLYRGGKGAVEWAAKLSVDDPQDRESVSRKLENALRASSARMAADPRLGDRVRNAFGDAFHLWKWSHAMTPSSNVADEGFPYEPSLSLVSLVYPIKRKADLDVLNLSHADWPDPTRPGLQRSESVLDLMERAIDSIASVLEAFAELVEGSLPRSALSAVIGNGALSIAGEDGRPLPPIASDPLPLRPYLEEELASRRAIAMGR